MHERPVEAVGSVRRHASRDYTRVRCCLYVVDYADEVGPDDVVFESRGVKIVTDPKALSLIDGTEVDFVASGLSQAFAFRNPNVTGECGCGESFSIAPESA